jgi:alanine dehydrogenase
MEPTFDADWLEPGMHVTNLGPAEISHEVLDRVDVKVRQGTSGVEMPETDHIKGGIGHSPMAYIAGTEDDRKRLPIRDDKTSGFKVNFPDYCDIMTDPSKGRTSDDQITYYHNMGFQGLQFASVGGLVYRKARAAGKGHEIPTELFLQDIRD